MAVGKPMRVRSAPCPPRSEGGPATALRARTLALARHLEWVVERAREARRFCARERGGPIFTGLTLAPCASFILKRAAQQLAQLLVLLSARVAQQRAASRPAGAIFLQTSHPARNNQATGAMAQRLVLVKVGGGRWYSDVDMTDEALMGLRRMALLKVLKRDDSFAVKLRDVALDDCTVRVCASASNKAPSTD